MPFIEMRWLEVLLRPQIPLNDAMGLVEGSIESSCIGEDILRSSEVVKRLHHMSGEVNLKVGVTYQASER